MKVKIEKGILCVNVADLLDNLDDEVKEDLIENLSCQDDVIKRVADQIFDGWTERCSYGPKSCSASEEPRNGLDYAMRKFAKVDELAKKEIERLEESLKLEKDAHQITRGVVEKLRGSREIWP